MFAKIFKATTPPLGVAQNRGPNDDPDAGQDIDVKLNKKRKPTTQRDTSNAAADYVGGVDGVDSTQKGYSEIMKSAAHPGFDAVAARIADKEGVPLDRAKAILAASSRGASAAAKKRNPRLKRV